MDQLKNRGGEQHSKSAGSDDKRPDKHKLDGAKHETASSTGSNDSRRSFQEVQWQPWQPVGSAN